MSDTPVRRVKRGWMNLRVDRIVEDTHDTKTFYFVDAEEGGRPFDYIAGQYLTFRFDSVAEKPVVRSYTMSSSNCEADYSAVTVKRVEGGLISNWLCDEVKQDSVLRARGPIGKFVYDAKIDRPTLLMVAGGSGVTPFVSILREYKEKLGQPGCPEKMALLVAYRSKQDLICWDVLEPLMQGGDAAVITTLTREKAEGFWNGRPSVEMLEKAFTEYGSDVTIMTCGPEALMETAIVYANSAGIAEDQIKTESFA